MKTIPPRRTHCALAWAAVAVSGACLLSALPATALERGPVRKLLAAPVETEARVIVKFKADSALMRPLSATAGAVLPQHAKALSARLGMSLTDGRMIGSRVQVLKARGMSSRQLADRLAAQSDVEYAAVDGRKFAFAAPSDPLYAGGQPTTITPTVGQWYLRAPNAASIVNSSSVLASINAEAAWAITKGKKSVVVAVLDTGVRPEHPDLAGKLLPGYDFVGGVGTALALATANDGNGPDSDPTDPGDGITAAEANDPTGNFYHQGQQNSVGAYIGETSSWHGTQTSGMIGAATNNGIGMAGAGRDVMILPLRVLGKGGGYDSDIQAAMLWAVGVAVPGLPANPNPAKVLNMSFGSDGACTQTYLDALAQIKAHGAVAFVAAGNDGLAVGTPANCAGAQAVAGLRQTGTKVSYSNLGPEVAISAPAGNCVNDTGQCLYPLLSTSNSGSIAPGTSIYTDGGDDATLGTSFSTPLAAATAALMFSANPTLTPDQLITALKASATAFPSSGAPPSQHAPDGPNLTVNACVAPSSTDQFYECYCTTTTCGAGMLNAAAAVARVAILNANIDVASTSVTAGTAVALSGAGSSTVAGRTVTGYQWTITDGAGIATITSASNASTVTVLPSAGGSVTVSLVVTDGSGSSDTSSTTLTVAPAPVVVSSGGGGGGGGAMQLGWLLGWLAALVGVWAVTPRRVSVRHG